MPFWKRKKPEEKGGPEKRAPPAKVEKPTETKGPVPSEKPKESPREAAAKPGAKAVAAPLPADLEAVVTEVHAGLVDLGLTIPGTKGVFTKKVSAYAGGPSAFVATYKEKPYRAGTQILVDWLGFRVPADGDPAKLLEDMNLRLSSFKLSVQMGELTWLDQDLGLRKVRLHLGDQEKVVRFKDARDFVKGVNDLLAPKKLAFLELETWSGEFAFLLVREPKWEKLAETKLVVVKAPQTAVGGECGECGAPVGANWHDCLSCGAVFGTE